MWHQQFVTHAHKHTCWSPLAVIDMKGPSVTGLSIKCGFQCSILWSKSHAPHPPSLQHLIQMSAAPDTVCVPAFTQSQTHFHPFSSPLFYDSVSTWNQNWPYLLWHFPDLIMHNSSVCVIPKKKKIFLHYLSSKCNYLLWHSLSVDVT